MKDRKVVGALACALACALSASANTTTNWFEVGVSGGDLSLTGVTTNGVAITIDSSKIVLDNDSSSALTFTPTNTPALNDGLVTIQATADLTPSSTNDLTTVAEAKTGFAVGINDQNATNYYGYTEDGWVKLGDTSPTSLETSFKLIIDYRANKVKFFVDGNQIGTADGYTIAAASNLASIDAFGSGSITSIDTDYEVAVAAAVTDSGATTNLYGSATEAIIAAGASGSVKDITASGEATDAKLADNGLAKWECDALNLGYTETLALAQSPIAVENRITLQLAEANQPATGVTATFGVSKDGGVASGSYPYNCIQIPLENGTYKIVPNITAAPAP